MARRRSAGPGRRRAFFCAAAGFVLTVLVAWLSGVVPDYSLGQASFTAAEMKGDWPLKPPSDWPRPDYWTYGIGFCTSLEQASSNLDQLVATRRQDPGVVVHSMVVNTYGFPFRALRTRRLSVQAGRRITALDVGWFKTGRVVRGRLNPDGFATRRIAFEPVWHGFVLDWLFYSGVVLGLWAGLAAWRRRRRARAGRCVACAYPTDGLGTCPECGLPVQGVFAGAAGSLECT